MEEKRKRTGEDDGISKRFNSRSRRQEEHAHPTSGKEVVKTSMKSDGSDQSGWMEVDDSTRKGKEPLAPTYKLRSDIEQPADLQKVLEEKVLDNMSI